MRVIRRLCRRMVFAFLASSVRSLGVDLQSPWSTFFIFLFRRMISASKLYFVTLGRFKVLRGKLICLTRTSIWGQSLSLWCSRHHPLGPSLLMVISVVCGIRDNPLYVICVSWRDISRLIALKIIYIGNLNWFNGWTHTCFFLSWMFIFVPFLSIFLIFIFAI